MNLIAFKGFMIPGIHFENSSIWVLDWFDTPTGHKKMTEVWILNYDGQKTCYIDPEEAIPVLEKYHSFHQIIPAKIKIVETSTGLTINIDQSEQEVLSLNLEFKTSLKFRLINWFIAHCKQISEKGQTENGKAFQNIPHRLLAISVKKAIYQGRELQVIPNPKIAFELGDGKPTNTPIINYCTHMLED